MRKNGKRTTIKTMERNMSIKRFKTLYIRQDVKDITIVIKRDLYWNY